jgi:hypothetical protein
VGLSVALALLGFAVVRRFVPMEFREAHNANTAVIFGALYVMYGLLVGFSAYFTSYQYDTRRGPPRPAACRSCTAWQRASPRGSGGRCKGWRNPTPGPWWKRDGL